MTIIRHLSFDINNHVACSNYYLIYCNEFHFRSFSFDNLINSTKSRNQIWLKAGRMKRVEYCL